MNIQSRVELDTIPLASFTAQLGRELPKLIQLLNGQEIRQHFKWGTIIPYTVPMYGNGASPGHCVRPDVVLTKQGPKICELDFVASGRAHLLNSLREFPQARQRVLEGFAKWYRAMGAQKIWYATGTKTSCFHETELFSDSLRSQAGLDISAVNLDEMYSRVAAGNLVDRLSYRSELDNQDQVLDQLSSSGALVSTAQPYLDSKAIFALLHDKEIDSVLARVLGHAGLKFWRNVVPYTVLLSDVGTQLQDVVCNDHKLWLVKNTDVETDYCWGSRGTILGPKYRQRDFEKLIIGGKVPGRKVIGANPILQRFHESVDCTDMWNRAVSQGIAERDAEYFGRELDLAATQPADKQVCARIGMFMTIARGTVVKDTNCCAEVVLRQDHLVHGASDAIALAVRLS